MIRMGSNEWIVLITTIFLLAIVIWRFALTLKEGSFYSGVFSGKFKEISRQENAVRFYVGLSVRIVFATLAILGSSWVLYEILQG